MSVVERRHRELSRNGTDKRHDCRYCTHSHHAHGMLVIRFNSLSIPLNTSPCSRYHSGNDDSFTSGRSQTPSSSSSQYSGWVANGSGTYKVKKEEKKSKEKGKKREGKGSKERKERKGKEKSKRVEGRWRLGWCLCDATSQCNTFEAASVG